MRAVNLIPKDARRGRGPASGFSISPAYTLLGALAVLLVFVVVYVLESNTISDRKAQLANVQTQLAAQQAEATRLAKYVQFETLAQTRVQTVRAIAGARFDWYRALSDLSRVVPANTSLASLTGTVAPGASAASAGGGSGGSASSLRADLPVPAFELTGCTKTQDDVARLMSRLRVINGVTRVTLGNSQKTGGTSGAAVSSTPGGGCGDNTPSFDLVVFFQSLPGAGATGVTSLASQPASAAPSQAGTATTAAPSTATTATTATPATTTAPAATATPAAAGTPATTATTAASGGSK